MTIKGFVTAAGKGSRWGLYYKELLPVCNNSWLLDESIKRLENAGVDEVIIITTPEKVTTHSTHLRDRFDIPISYVMQRGNELWGAIRTACLHSGDINLLTMSDTLPSKDCFDFNYKGYDFGLGAFLTSEPERFGVITKEAGKLVVKDKYKAEGVAHAWGTFWFSKTIAYDWLHRKELENYTDGINYALHNFNYEVIDFGRYYDMADFIRYKEFLNDKFQR